ncbi:MAG: hypothetical protein JWO55_119 [Candidatus Saccharibacteria bacterium]|nr:hypothetical protein [Candidatus Saccharibacteria bacterium]
MKTSCNRAVKFATIGLLAMFAFAMMGVAPANALVDSDFGVTATASPTTPGQGSLTIATHPGFPVPMTVSVFVVGTGGTLAGDVYEQPVTLTGAPVSVAYSCVGSSMELGVTFPGKGGPGFGVVAPCGAVVAAPAPLWNQSATIHPGADGSGNADVVFNNTGSNRDGGFHVTIGNGAPTSATSVAAGQTKSIPVHAEPGTVIRVYGTKDGTAAPQLLRELTLPKAPAAPAPLWNQSATITVGAPGSGNASVSLTNKSNAPAVYVVYEGDKELPGYTVPIGKTVTDSLSGLTPGRTLFVYGIKDGSASLGQPLARAEIPAASVVVPPSGSPTAGKPAVQPGQPAIKAAKKTGADLTELTFKTGATSSVVTQSDQQQKYWTAGPLVALAAIIIAFVFRRRTAK